MTIPGKVDEKINRKTAIYIFNLKIAEATGAHCRDELLCGNVRACPPDVRPKEGPHPLPAPSVRSAPFASLHAAREQRWNGFPIFH